MENILPVYTYNLTCAEMLKAYLDSARQICEYLQRSQSLKKVKLKEDILQYIDTCIDIYVLGMWIYGYDVQNDT